MYIHTYIFKNIYVYASHVYLYRITISEKKSAMNLKGNGEGVYEKVWRKEREKCGVKL